MSQDLKAVEAQMEEFIKQFDRRVTVNGRVRVLNAQLTEVQDTSKKRVNCESYETLCKRFAGDNGGERFFGEKVAMAALSINNDNAHAAWDAMRAHRKTYPGLREQDRNAEHYLYALDKVRRESYLYGPFQTFTTGYNAAKFWVNALGEAGKIAVGKNYSPFRGTPPSTDELKAGYFGANDGLYGIPK